MKKVVFVISEYNPFHLGHEYHLAEIRRREPEAAIVSVMSGNFVQRGEVAAFDKYVRARCAVMGGADLVVELPAPYSFGCAEWFSDAACRIAGALREAFDAEGILSFGTEYSDEKELRTTAARLASREFQRAMADHQKKTGIPAASPAAVYAVYASLWGDCPLLSAPNSTLALSYIRSLEKYDIPLSLLPILRRGSGHDDKNLPDGADAIASASAVRRRFADDGDSPFLPVYTRAALQKEYAEGRFFEIENAERVILSCLRDAETATYFDQAADVYGGYGARLHEAAKNASGYGDLLLRAKSKHYTDARIRRMILSCVLGCGKEQMRAAPRYTVLLAASRRGIALLHDMKSTDLAVLTKPSGRDTLPEAARAQYDFARRCDRFYALTAKTVLPDGDMLTQTPFIAG